MSEKQFSKSNDHDFLEIVGWQCWPI